MDFILKTFVIRRWVLMFQASTDPSLVLIVEIILYIKIEKVFFFFRL